jgi:hypothetical protein
VELIVTEHRESLRDAVAAHRLAGEDRQNHEVEGRQDDYHASETMAPTSVLGSAA